jgi:D-alanyl-D-alanine carboxypeptidase
VIEAVSGETYYDYVERHIYAPAGMTATGALPESESVPDRAHAYTKVDGEWVRETATLPWRGMAAGGSYTTARDLLRFATALQGGALISAESFEAATRPQNHQGWYGYGFMVSGDGDDRQFGHEGGAPGSNAILNVRPAHGCTVIGLSNFDPSMMANVVNYVTRRLP